MLFNQKQHIHTFFYRHTSKVQTEYQTCLNVIVGCVPFFFFKARLRFCAHNEFYNSSNQGNCFEFVRFHTIHNENIYDVAFKNALDNLKLT